MSPTKKQQADAAHERQEDQRALVVVIAAALGEERAEERARIYEAVERVKAAFLRIDAPTKSPELPGQLGIDGSIVGEPAAPVRDLGCPMAEAFDVPKQCPKCGENMLLTYGGAWVPLARGEFRPCRLQCGFCAEVITVPGDAYDAVVAERKRTVGESDRKPLIAKRAPRVRGAG